MICRVTDAILVLLSKTTISKIAIISKLVNPQQSKDPCLGRPGVKYNFSTLSTSGFPVLIAFEVFVNRTAWNCINLIVNPL